MLSGYLFLKKVIMKKTLFPSLLTIAALLSSCNSKWSANNTSTLHRNGKVPVGEYISDNYQPSEVDTTALPRLNAQAVQKNSVPDAKTLAQPTPTVAIKYPDVTYR